MAGIIAKELVICHLNEERFSKQAQLAAIKQKSVHSIDLDEIEDPVYRHLESFLHYLTMELETENPYNDHSLFANIKVLFEGIGFAQNLVEMERHRLSGGKDLFVRNKFEKTLPVTGFDHSKPILLDRTGKVILDGYERYIIAFRVGMEVNVKVLDISDAQAEKLYKKQSKTKKP